MIVEECEAGPSCSPYDASTSSSSSSTGAKGAPRLFTLPCHVCGYPANGHHYEVPSCQPCASFFQRSIRAARAYSCSFGGECIKAGSSHRILSCRSCRLKRCLTAGMKPEYAHASSSKAGICRRNCEEHLENLVAPTSSLQVYEARIEKELAYLVVVETAYERLRNSRHDIRCALQQLTLETTLRGPSLLGVHFGDMPGWPVERLRYVEEMPTAEDRVRDRQQLPDLMALWPPNAKNWNVDYVIYGVEYLKTMPFFLMLDEADKKIVAAHTAFGCSIATSSYYAFTRGEDVPVHPDGQRPCTEVNRDSRFYRSVRALIARLLELRISHREYLLLKRLYACTTSAEMSARGLAVLEVEQEVAVKSLLSHVLATHGIKEGPLRYLALLDVVNSINTVVKIHKEVFMQLAVHRLLRDFGECPLLLTVNMA